MKEPHHSHERRNTPAENRRLDLVLECLAVVAWLVAIYHLLDFTLRAFLG